eukprot:gene31771-41236_t
MSKVQPEDQLCPDAEKYIRNCKFMDIRVDPSVLISLQTKWDLLRPSKKFAEGAMLPLKDILKLNNHITNIDLSSTGMMVNRVAGNGNSNARVLKEVLKSNNNIHTVNVSDTGLDDYGLKELCEGLQANNSVTDLNLSFNHFGEKGADYLSAALTKNYSIKKLDLSRNALGFRSISSLLCVCVPKNMSVIKHGNYVFEEILNSVSHGIAFIGAVIGGNLLISEAVDVYKTDFHFWACVLYSFALMFLFLSSCLYHSFFMLPSTSRILQILDHVGIYMVIAGTLTPFSLITLNHHTSARVFITAEWIFAVLGSIFATCSDLNAPITTMIELVLFLIMGMGIFIIWGIVLQEFSNEQLVLFVLGGVFYIIGIAFFILGEVKPIYHVIWHIFVIIAATIHWFDVYLFVLSSGSLSTSPARAAVSDLVADTFSVATTASKFITASIENRFHSET